MTKLEVLDKNIYIYNIYLVIHSVTYVKNK